MYVGYVMHVMYKPTNGKVNVSINTDKCYCHQHGMISIQVFGQITKQAMNGHRRLCRDSTKARKAIREGVRLLAAIDVVESDANELLRSDVRRHLMSAITYLKPYTIMDP